MRTQGIIALALLLQLHSCAAAPTPDTHDVEGTARASPEDGKATTTDSARRSLISGADGSDCLAIARRGGPIPKRCVSGLPLHIGIPVWDEDDGEIGTATDSAKRSLSRRIPPKCIPDGSGGCTKDTTSASEDRPFFGGEMPGVAAPRRDASEKKRIVLQPGMEPINTPTHVGDLTLHIGRSDSDSDSDEKRYACPIIDRRSDGTVVRSCLGDPPEPTESSEPSEPTTGSLNLTSDPPNFYERPPPFWRIPPTRI